MKKIFRKTLVILMLIVFIFEAAMPPGLLFRKTVYAEEEKPWYEKVGEAVVGAVVGNILNGANFVMHQAPGGDLILETLKEHFEGTEYQNVVQYLTTEEYIPDRTGWYKANISNNNDATGATQIVNGVYNKLTDETGKRSELFIYYRNEAGEICYPSFKREFEFELGTNATAQQVYLTRGTVYYVPRYMTLNYVPAPILEELEAMAANMVYSIANGVHVLMSWALGQSVTIDDLVFNKYSETNISYFDTKDEAGELASSLIYGNNDIGGLDNVINDWYSIFQKIAIMGYMAILVYMGVRIMLGATADQKADYKKLFMDWVIGVAILFLFPYAMSTIIDLNEAFVKTIDENKGVESKKSSVLSNIDTSNDFSKISIDDEIDWDNGDDYMSKIANAAYQSQKLILSIVFLIMTWQLIALIFHYFKRLFMVAFLIIIFPLVALSYAVDKIADGKSQAFNTWFKEFFLNVFVQSFHAIVYVFVCSTIYSATETATGAATAATASFDYILVIVGVTFLFKGEEIIREIFGQTSGAGTMKSLSQSAVGTFAKMALVKDGIKFAASHTVGEKSILRKAHRGFNNIKAANARVAAFDAMAKTDEEYNIGQRLPHHPKAPGKDASDEEIKNFKENQKYFQAAAILNNPKSHSHEEKAMAESVLKKLAMENPEHTVFKDSNMTPGQFQALAKLDNDVQLMIMGGMSTIDIEKNVTARLGMVFPNETDEQVKQRVDTYFTDLFLNGTAGGVGGSKPVIRGEVDETLRAIEREESSINYGHNRKLSGKEVEKLSEQMYLDTIAGREDELSDDEKEEIRNFAKEVFILNRRKFGEYTNLEMLRIVDEVRHQANDENASEEILELKRKMLEEKLDSELDIDTLAHVMARKDMDAKGVQKDTNHYRLAREIAKDYEDNPREGYYDDEISSHELIMHRGNPDEIEKIIDTAYESRKEASDEMVSSIAGDILANRNVDILENSHDTQVRLQEGRAYEEVLGNRLNAVNNLLNDLNPLRLPDNGLWGEKIGNASFFDLYAKDAILRKEEERTGITRNWKQRLFIDSKPTKELDSFIDERVSNRDKIRDDHFYGDIDREKK